MKLKLALFAITLLLSACFENQGATFHFDAETVCPESARGYFTDDRDGKEYKYTTIGNQVWMAENLNYANEFRYCMDKYIENYCEIYGGQYQWVKWEDHLTACPNGWHLPTRAEWEELIDVMGGEKYVNKGVLRTKEGWPDTLGTDICGFAALPGGGGTMQDFNYQKTLTQWWTATLKAPRLAETYYMNKSANYFMDIGVNDIGVNLIRCVKD